MGEEKVKEIRKAWECCTNSEIYDCTFCPYRNVSSDCQENLIYDMGVYINELEIERGEIAIKNNKLVFQTIELLDENKELKDRIAELEKENKILKGTKNRLTFADRIKLIDNAFENQLKQFAERLVKKYGCDPLTHELDEDIEIHLTASELDETLKEFINGKV